MERFTLVTNISSCHSQKPTTLPVSFPIKPKQQRRRPTFTSYVGPDQNPIPFTDTELSIFTAERYFNDNNHDNLKENRQAPAERVHFDLDVERSDLCTFTRDSSVSSVDGRGRNGKNEPFHVAPTASSEASWNSRSGLLTNPPGNAAVTLRACNPAEQRKGASPSSTSSPSRWLFGRRCPCSGKRSVDVEERSSEPKILDNSNFNSGADGSSANLKKQSIITVTASSVKSIPKLTLISGGEWEQEKEVIPNLHSSPGAQYYPSGINHRIVTSGSPFPDCSGFSFPILTQSTEENQEPPRESLEVFRPKDELAPLAKPFEFQQWKKTPENNNSNRRNFTFPAGPKPRILDDDIASDSSSDLFEIESFSTQRTAGTTSRRRDSLDEILSMDPRRFIDNPAGILQLRHGMEEPARLSNAPSECYPPSEVSVQWSVTTAEGFDRASVANFSSAASEYENVAFVVPEKKKVNGGLLSCRNEKAVSVGPRPVRCMQEQRRVEDGIVSTATASVGNGRGSERPVLARSYSARLTRPIQTR